MGKGLRVRINYPRSRYHGCEGYVEGMTVPDATTRSALVIHDTVNHLKHRVDAEFVVALSQ